MLEPEITIGPFRETHEANSSITHLHSNERKQSIEDQSAMPQFAGSEDEGEELELDVQNHYQSDCPTCQKNWDLLNRNQRHSIAEHNGVNSNGETKAPLLTFPRNGDSTPTCLSFDLDGLLPSVDRQQVRLGQILASKEVFENFFTTIHSLMHLLIDGTGCFTS